MNRYAISCAGACIAVLWAQAAMAHGIGGSDAIFVSATHGPAPGPFLYLGAKHMVTGYDHLLFLAGVIFFLRRLRDVLIYMSLFSLGHSITLLSGVLLGFGLNSYLVDAVIGLSVAWKAFDNIGGFDGAPIRALSCWPSASSMGWASPSGWENFASTAMGWLPICWLSTWGSNWGRPSR